MCPIPKDTYAKNEIEEDKTRPISLMEVLDKWLQRLFYNRIHNDIEFNQSQAGFKLGCDFNTTLLSESIAASLTKSIIIFTDIAKAFDSVQNHELVDAIWASKLKPIYKRILSSFTENRYYRVELRDTQGRIVNSRWRKMIYGTPQGSVFGPVLWNMFFDPLLRKLETILQLP